MSGEQVPTEQRPAERVPAERVPAERVPAEQVATEPPAEQVAAEQIPAEQVATEQVATEQLPVGRAAGGGSARARQGVGDIVRSMALVLLVVGGLVFFTVRSTGTTDPVIKVDYSADLAAARLAAPYALLAPVGLDGYRATSVRYDDDTDATVWHIGFVTPAQAYVGLDQTDGPPADFVADLTEGATPSGEVGIDGVTWERYDGGGSSADELVRALVRADGPITVLVSGTAEWAELEEFTTALDAG